MINLIKKIIIITISLLIHLKSFAIGRDILNFYIEVPEKNLYQSYGEFESKVNTEFYKWKVGTGTSQLSESIIFDYDIERKFDKTSNATGWENTFSIYKKFEEKKFFNKNWYSDIGPYIKFNYLDIGGDFSNKIKENKYSLRYRIRTTSEIGLGGTYWGGDLFLSSIDTYTRDGYSLEANLTGITNIGYGFQNFFTIYNEYSNYGNDFYGTYLFRIENLFKWTYDLNENFAISFETEMNSYNYFRNTNQDKIFKITLGPQILYSQDLRKDFRVFSKIGFYGFSYEDIRTKTSKFSQSGKYIRIKIGFEFIF